MMSDQLASAITTTNATVAQAAASWIEKPARRIRLPRQ